MEELWDDIRKLMIEYAVNISTDEGFEIMISNKVIDILKDKYDLRLKKDIDKRFTEEDMINSVVYGADYGAVFFQTFKKLPTKNDITEYLQSLNK